MSGEAWVASGNASQNAVQGKEDIVDTPIEFLISFLSDLQQQTSSIAMPESARHLIDQSLELATGLYTYPKSVSSEISADAKHLVEKTKEIDYDALFQSGQTGQFRFFKEMSSDVLQANLLKMLVRMTGARNILEIGTFTGFAALNMAEALPSDGRLVTMELFPFFAQFARDFFAQSAQKGKIEVQEGSAIDLLKTLGEKKESFDVIFIDAAKGQYKDYLSLVLDLSILAPRGTILFDNTLYKGAPFMKEFPKPAFARGGPVMNEFNTILKNESRVEQVLIPINDGLTIARRVGE